MFALAPSDAARGVGRSPRQRIPTRMRFSQTTLTRHNDLPPTIRSNQSGMPRGTCDLEQRTPSEKLRDTPSIDACRFVRVIWSALVDPLTPCPMMHFHRVIPSTEI